MATGGTRLDVVGTGGWFDLGLVDNADHSANNSAHPGSPGNFTCEQ